jgi:Tol biopolymer transport system component
MAEGRGTVDDAATAPTVDSGPDATTAGPARATTTTAAGEPAVLAPGSSIGRYVVSGELGRGGMGVVVAARDPDLQRTVAIKLVRPRGARVSDEMRQRLLREGQAIAQLSHPNVVQIHDVGVHGAEVFIAMEHVEGATLTRWLAAPRTRAAILDVFAQAGRGLAAAHAKGIVHRDFKPDNVRVGDDGRVRVLDFGLARGAGAAELATAGDGAALTETMTGHGAILGTPAYMAPEQFRGDRAGELADQFAFAVALHEALCGERPFTGATLDALGAAVIAGRRRPMPRAAKVPAWLERAIARALAPEPADRYPSIAAMLAAIARDPVAARRRWVVAGAAIAAIGGAAALAIAATRDDPTPVPDAAPRLEPTMRQIVREDGVHLHPSFTPDAARFVHTDGTDLLVRAIDGTVIANLTADFAPRATEPELSPDGSRIAFVAGGTIHVIGVDGGAPQPVTPGFWPTWSPDGAQLAYVTADVFDIYLRVDRVGGELWRVALATGARTRIGTAEDAMQPDWSPDGTRIVFVAGKRLAIVRADGTGLRESAIGNAWHPVWDAGGAIVYAARERGGRYEVAAYPVDGSDAIDAAEVRPVTALSPAPVWHFDVARDGRRFIAAVYVSEHRTYRVPFDPAAGRATGLPQPFGDAFRGLQSPAVSPDGALIAFSAVTEVEESLFVMPLAGGAGRVIAGGHEYVREPSWKPDGSAITYRGTIDDEWGIRTVTPDGKTTGVLYDDSDYKNVRWAPDGRRLAITGGSGADNHPFVVAADLPWDPQTSIETPALAGWRTGPWSPDGARVAVFSRRGVGLLDPAVDPAARTVTVVADRGQDAVWLDPRRLVVAAGHDLFLVDTRGGAATPLVSLAPGRATELPCLSATPTRDALFVGTTIDHATLWLVDLSPAR